MINKGRILAVSGLINLDPSKHDQTQWMCGTSFCYGGHAIVLFLEEEYAWSPSGYLLVRPESELLSLGYPSGSRYYRQAGGRFEHADWSRGNSTEDVWVEADTGAVAASLLGLEDRDQAALFDATNTLADVNRIALAIVEGKPYKHAKMCGCNYCFDEIEDY